MSAFLPMRRVSRSRSGGGALARTPALIASEEVSGNNLAAAWRFAGGTQRMCVREADPGDHHPRGPRRRAIPSFPYLRANAEFLEVGRSLEQLRRGNDYHASLDRREVMAAIKAHYQLPPPRAIPSRLTIKYGFRRSASLDFQGIRSTIAAKSRNIDGTPCAASICDAGIGCAATSSGCSSFCPVGKWVSY